MLRSRLLVAILLLSAFLFSCAGEDGATGPAGAKGADGNANVIVFTYGTRTGTGMIQYSVSAAPELVDTSIVIGFYAPSNYPTFWYPVPGLGPINAYSTRNLIAPAGTTAFTYEVQIRTPDGTASYPTAVTFTKFKIFIVPASVVIPVTSRGLLDLSDYNAVRDFLKLPE